MDSLRRVLGFQSHQYEKVAAAELVPTRGVVDGGPMRAATSTAQVRRRPGAALCASDAAGESLPRKALMAGHRLAHANTVLTWAVLMPDVVLPQLSVKGMTCSACTSAVEGALRWVQGGTCLAARRGQAFCLVRGCPAGVAGWPRQQLGGVWASPAAASMPPSAHEHLAAWQQVPDSPVARFVPYPPPPPFLSAPHAPQLASWCPCRACGVVARVSRGGWRLLAPAPPGLLSSQPANVPAALVGGSCKAAAFQLQRRAKSAAAQHPAPSPWGVHCDTSLALVLAAAGGV